MIEFEHNGQQYKAEKLTAFQQFHISRRIAPLVPPLAPILLAMTRGQGIISNAQLLQPFADGLGSMKDEDAEYVLATCLVVVKRRVGDAWQPVWNSRAKMAMFEDLNDLGQLFPIALRVLQDSLAPFIKGILSTSNEQGPPAG